MTSEEMQKSEHTHKVLGPGRHLFHKLQQLLTGSVSGLDLLHRWHPVPGLRLLPGVGIPKFSDSDGLVDTFLLFLFLLAFYTVFETSKKNQNVQVSLLLGQRLEVRGADTTLATIIRLQLTLAECVVG